MDIALDSESKGRGFKSHYDQYIFVCFYFYYCFCFLARAESDILASSVQSCTLAFACEKVVPLPLGLLPSVRIVTECRTVAALTFYGAAVVSKYRLA